ncbi:MAG: carbamoyltransferase HypF [Acidobacteriota bacterium]|nr:MAG: carbamoyltransferase HypF [Acidobacteriota bacterium]
MRVSGQIEENEGSGSWVGGGDVKRRFKIGLQGAVQGVGFRPFVYRLARELELNGWVQNSGEGVFIEIEGTPDRGLRFIERLRTEKPSHAAIQSLETYELDPVGYREFKIDRSTAKGKRTLILPDLATCPDCLREIRDPANRRFRYPFTNCTNCGPRFSIILSLPYDRPNTTMREFPLCKDCAKEYEDPTDRRFHAQPTACPECGPALRLLNREGASIAVGPQALEDSCRAIRAGKILALKGIGGYQLIVDAANGAAVARLRHRKQRRHKPLALMCRDVEQVSGICRLSSKEKALLCSAEAPIVLLEKSSGCSSLIADEVAPANPNLGVMLPYSPLHYLIMDILPSPVVATSGNLSEEPICTDDDAALTRLEGIADLFLAHNRPIARHVDDSIARIICDRELILRRARGFAPLPLHLSQDLPPLLAVGPHLKNTIALSVGKNLFSSQHIGDLETEQSLEAFERVVADFRRLYEVEPVQIAHDLHPGYVSTQFAEKTGIPGVAVQHHYAHVLACMAENDLRAPALGLAWDGTGYGTDGTIWGGEFLSISDDSYERAAALRHFSLPGGEAAVKEPRRSAIGLLFEIFGERCFALTDLPAVRAFNASETRTIGRMLEREINSPRTTSMGRLFDAVAAILGVRQICGYEGQAAMELEFLAGEIQSDDRLSIVIQPCDTSPSRLVVNWESMIHAVIERWREKKSVQSIARAFHNTMADLAVRVAEKAAQSQVVLTGGCFQNRLLTETTIQYLKRAGFQPYWHQRIPPNDGGVSVGQLVAAARNYRRGR